MNTTKTATARIQEAGNTTLGKGELRAHNVYHGVCVDVLAGVCAHEEEELLVLTAPLLDLTVGWGPGGVKPVHTRRKYMNRESLRRVRNKRKCLNQHHFRIRQQRTWSSRQPGQRR